MIYVTRSLATPFCKAIPLPVVSRLLGHKQPSMTLRYAHVADREIEAAAERIGVAIARALDGSGVSQDDCLDPPAFLRADRAPIAGAGATATGKENFGYPPAGYART